MLRKLGGSVGGSRSPNLKVTSHHFIMFPVSEKKKKIALRGGSISDFLPEEGTPPPLKRRKARPTPRPRGGNVVNLVSMDTWQQHPSGGTLPGTLPIFYF